MDDQWTPRRAFPPDQVHPVRVDASGRAGPTIGRSTGPSWRRTSRGLFVPVGVPRSAEQLIVEVASGMPTGAMVTGWAALRLYGGGFFDGLDAWLKPVPVPILVDADQRLRSSVGRRVLRDRALPEPAGVHGIACAPVERAVIDAMRLADGGREAVVALDMALAAHLTTARRVRDTWDAQIRRVGAALVRFGLRHAAEGSRSPFETRLRLVWTLDAGLPSPMLNAEVRTLDGRLVGVPDLLDPATGLCAEYDGAAHRDRDRHRHDNARREGFVEAGLEPVTVVAGESAAEVTRRLRAAWRRARRRRSDERSWVICSSEELNQGSGR